MEEIIQKISQEKAQGSKRKDEKENQQNVGNQPFTINNQPLSAEKCKFQIKKTGVSTLFQHQAEQVLEVSFDGKKSSLFTKKNLAKFAPQKIINNEIIGIDHYQKFIVSNIGQQKLKKFIVQLYKGVIYSTKTLKVPSLDLVKSCAITLRQPVLSKRKFLMLDLDETIIYAEKAASIKKNEAVFEVSFRPGTFEFLAKMSEYFEIYIFTAATKKYAQAAVQRLNCRKKVIRDILCRDHCFQTKKGRFIKDLRIIENRELKDIVIIDNLVSSFGLQIDNGIPILEFTGNQDDQQLNKIQDLLIELSEAEDVREILKKRLKLREFAEVNKQSILSYASINKQLEHN